MNQHSLAFWLKFIIILVGCCGLVVYLYAIPSFIFDMAEQFPEYAYCATPWLVFLWISAFPCFAVLGCGWKIAKNIGLNHSFCKDNAKMLKQISYFTTADLIYFFIGQIVFLLIGYNHPAIFIASIAVMVFALAIAIASAILSHLVLKASDLQEENDLVI